MRRTVAASSASPDAARRLAIRLRVATNEGNGASYSSSTGSVARVMGTHPALYAFRVRGRTFLPLTRSGPRVSARRTIRVRHRQTCVVGGFTEHRRARRRALLLGVYDTGRLQYIGRALTAVSEAP